MQPGQMAYDRAITVFSPDGRLFQVEYARVAVTRGNTTVGLKFKNGIVLMADKKLGSRLVETASIEKIFQIDDHVGAATSGLVADARVLVDYARLVAQINKVTYSEKIGVDLLVKRICDYKQNYTQYGGVRPFGTALLVAGVDDLGTHLFETDPSGALVSYKAGSIGQGRQAVMELLEEKYREGMNQDDSIVLGLEGVRGQDGRVLRDDRAARRREADHPARRDPADHGTASADVGGEAQADRPVHRGERDQPADEHSPSTPAHRERDGGGQGPHRPVQTGRGAGEGGPRRAAAPHPDPLREGPDRGQVERGRQREILRGHQRLRDDPERGVVPDGSLARRRRDARGLANGLPGAVEREDERKRGDADPEGGPASLSRTEYQDVASKGRHP